MKKSVIRLGIGLAITLLVSAYLWTEPSRKLKRALIGDWNVGTVYIDGVDKTIELTGGILRLRQKDKAVIPHLRRDPYIRSGSAEWNIKGDKIQLIDERSSLAQSYNFCFLFGGQSMILELESDHLLLYLHKGLIPTELDRKRNFDIYKKFACDTTNDEPPVNFSQWSRIKGRE